VDLIAKGTPGHCPGHPARHFIILEPDITAALTPNDSAACKFGPAFRACIDDDFSTARTDLQRDEAVVTFRITTAKSTYIPAHCTLLSRPFRCHQWHQTCQGLQIEIIHYFKEIS